MLDKIQNYLQKELPFVVYRKPKSSRLFGIFQPTRELNISSNLEEEGFVFAPFDSKDDTIVFRYSDCECIEEDEFVTELNNDEIHLSNHHQKEHVELVSKAIESLNKTDFKKVVLSRKERLESSVDILTTYKNLLSLYPSAFVYVWYHPTIGTWLGATPETLLNQQGTYFTTTALASTQKYQNSLDVTWGKKELEEHKIVVDFIENQLKSIGLSEFKTSKTKTIKAGSLLHLFVSIRGEISNHSLSDIVSSLHPTPAVCGLQKEKAKTYILKNENYKREFYTGFLGEINRNGSSDLYVNLRSMKVEENSAHIYVGGGITKESNPEKEWLETVAKTETIKKAIKLIDG